MTLNKAQVNEQISPQTTSFKKKWNWERDKKHLLLVIAGVCLALWLATLNGKVSWVLAVGNWLPLIGGLALVGEQLVKLI